LASLYVLDTEPIPVVGYKRSKKNSDFWGTAEYGYCASKTYLSLILLHKRQNRVKLLSL